MKCPVFMARDMRRTEEYSHRCGRLVESSLLLKGLDVRANLTVEGGKFFSGRIRVRSS